MSHPLTAAALTCTAAPKLSLGVPLPQPWYSCSPGTSPYTLGWERGSAVANCPPAAPAEPQLVPCARSPARGSRHLLLVGPRPAARPRVLQPAGHPRDTQPSPGVLPMNIEGMGH